jgi:hypothetical protein
MIAISHLCWVNKSTKQKDRLLEQGCLIQSSSKWDLRTWEREKIREIEVMQIGTFWSVPRAGGAAYGEDKTIVMTKDGRSMCSISAIGIGHFTGPGKVAFRGADLYNAEATGELSFLSNMVIVFEVEVD